MSNGPENFSFVPPTSPEVPVDPYAHLRMEFSAGERRYEKSPIEIFGEIGKELVTVEDITADDIVIMLQDETQHSLNTPEIRNLLGWANEEITRYRDSEIIAKMKKPEIFKHLFDYDFDFDDPKPKSKRSAA